ncbi:MAG: dTDP-4-dehydrorhamnose 3,5-epimerase [Cytophagales bacterium]|nr:dTDP-4-dehydrorhamnose 3,5-epimerase [Cytophagales bacterium]
MEFRKAELEGLLEIFPKVFEDERGYFFESYNKTLFFSNGIKEEFVQDNQSFSKKGVLRGLHFQLDPYAQGKLVKVTLGKVMDVVVDIRKDSSTYGKHASFLLEASKNNMLYIPPGFAHGFVTLEDAIFTYKCTNVYNKESEGGVLWNDPDLGIDWGVSNPIVSAKDMMLRPLKSI